MYRGISVVQIVTLNVKYELLRNMEGSLLFDTINKSVLFMSERDVMKLRVRTARWLRQSYMHPEDGH
jgi:hypothetical protein